MRLTTTNYQRLALKQNLLWLGITVLVLVIIMTAFSIFNTYNTDTVDAEVTKMRQPLNPTIDIDTVNQLRTRIEPSKQFTILKLETENGQEIVQPASATPTPTPTPSTSFIDTISTQSASASPSAQITTLPWWLLLSQTLGWYDEKRKL